MVKLLVSPSKISGTLVIPTSKSHTLRAILFAALSSGKSKIHAVLESPDTEAMIQAVCLLGATVTREHNTLLIEGVAGIPKVPNNIIDCGNSGQVLRFVGAVAGLIPEFTILTGDHSIRHHRPVLPLLGALKQLGAFAESSRQDGYAPIIIRGPLTKNYALLEGSDSQPVSGLLIAAAFAPFPIELKVSNPGEKPWIDLTLHWLNRFGIRYEMEHYTTYRLHGKEKIAGFEYTIPGDWSTASFPIAAALITGSEVTLTNISLEDIQGDKALIFLLQQMGADIQVNTQAHSLTVKKGKPLQGVTVDINDFVDALPILSVIACFAEGTTEITGAAIARKKESDRIHAICTELKKMGASIEEKEEGVVIHTSKLQGAELHTYHDHRIALSLSIAALGASTPSTIHGLECVAKTYPTFYEDFRTLGANFI